MRQFACFVVNLTMAASSEPNIKRVILVAGACNTTAKAESGCLVQYNKIKPFQVFPGRYIWRGSSILNVVFPCVSGLVQSAQLSILLYALFCFVI